MIQKSHKLPHTILRLTNSFVVHQDQQIPKKKNINLKVGINKPTEKAIIWEP